MIKELYQMNSYVYTKDFDSFKTSLLNLRDKDNFYPLFCKHCDDMVNFIIVNKMESFFTFLTDNLNSNSLKDLNFLKILTSCAMTNNFNFLNILFDKHILTKSAESNYDKYGYANPFKESFLIALKFGFKDFIEILFSKYGYIHTYFSNIEQAVYSSDCESFSRIVEIQGYCKQFVNHDRGYEDSYKKVLYNFKRAFETSLIIDKKDISQFILKEIFLIQKQSKYENAINSVLYEIYEYLVEKNEFDLIEIIHDNFYLSRFNNDRQINHLNHLALELLNNNPKLSLKLIDDRQLEERLLVCFPELGNKISQLRSVHNF